MREYRIYKPNSNVKGAASKIQLCIRPKKAANGKSYDDLMVFWECAPQIPSQNDNGAFDWKNSIKMKLSEVDIGEILCCFRRLKPHAGSEKGMFHQNQNGNSVLTLKMAENNAMFYFRMSVKRGDKSSACQHTISFGEAEIIRVLLEGILQKFYLGSDINTPITDFSVD